MAILALREEAEEQRAELQARLDKIEDERRDIIASARRQAEEEIRTFQREVKRLRSDMRTASLPLDALKAVQDQAAGLAAGLEKPVENEGEIIVIDSWTPRLGDNVWLPKLNAEGIISELEKNEAVVQVGSLKVRAALDEVAQRPPSQKRQMKRGHKREYEKSPDPIVPKGQSPGLELDLRGERVDDALREVDKFIDHGLRKGWRVAFFIHGHGTGVLRKALREHFEASPYVERSASGTRHQGGDGVTVIWLA
jgi:DNA mismatch repair protein MutS2